MRNIGFTVLLLGLSNIFMTFAWYAHLKELNQRPWIVAALVSWGIAFFEYMLQVPGNRIGYTVLSIGQLKLLQEVITLVVFVPFAVYYLKEPLKLDYRRTPLPSSTQRCQRRGSRYAESKLPRFGITTVGNDVASMTASCSMMPFNASRYAVTAYVSSAVSECGVTYGIARRM